MQSQYCNLQECVSDPKELCSVDLSKKDIYFLSVSGLRSKHVRNYLHLRLGILLLIFQNLKNLN